MILSIVSLTFASFILPSNAEDSCGRRDGMTYTLCNHHKEDFFRDGLAILPNIIFEDELKPIEEIYTQYMSEGSPEKQGKQGNCRSDNLLNFAQL